MSARPWYPFYPNDYESKTADLTLIQHGAYRRLLDHYYSTGKPLPANAGVLHRVCRAFDDAEKAAIKFIVCRYFVLDGSVYRQDRIDEELEKAADISEKRTNAAKSRYAKAHANAVQKHTQSQSQSQKKETPSLRSGVAQPLRRKTKSSLPENFPDETSRQWSETLWLQKGRADLCELMEDEIAKFRDHHTANNKSSADWPGSWRTWARNAINFSKVNGNGHTKPRSAHDKFLAGGAAYLRDLDDTAIG